jgi:HD-GYP domain-containing protein (c-di-GMP phosphodiesterase class II)
MGNVNMSNGKQKDGNLAALLYALSIATGLGFGGHSEHGLKCAYLGLQIADALALGESEREAIFYGALLKDIACTACAAGIAAFFPDDEQVSLSQVILIDPSSARDMIGWLSRYVPLDARFPTRITKLLSFMVHCGPIVKETMRSHCEVAELFARQLGFPDYVQQTLRFQWERWDGKGMAYGLKGPHIPLTARILHMIQVIELTYHFGDASSTTVLLREKRGTRFDPEVIDVFLKIAQQSDFWQTFDQATSETIMAMRPSTQADQIWENQVVRICEALADFVDLKTRETWHHSRIVADVATGIGTCLGLGKGVLIKLQCAALVHDVGKVAIPVNILTKEERRSSSEWEIYRLHPYYTQRILEQVTFLQDLATVAAAHHEWVNGQGYHRQLCGEQIPFHGRILAVANTYARLIEQQGMQKEPQAALRQMRPLVGVQFDKSCYDALVQSVGVKEGAKYLSPAPQKVGPLTERECEVLRLLAQGQNTPQIGHTLGISRKTDEHHLEHIYNKIGVTCRTAAVVYAVQQGLV